MVSIEFSAVVLLQSRSFNSISKELLIHSSANERRNKLLMHQMDNFLEERFRTKFILRFPFIDWDNFGPKYWYYGLLNTFIWDTFMSLKSLFECISINHAKMKSKE